MTRYLTLFARLAVLISAPNADAGIPSSTGTSALPASATFKVRHTLEVHSIPAEAKAVEIWFCVPGDHPGQRVRELLILDAPTGARLTPDASGKNRYLHALVKNTGQDKLSLSTAFTVQPDAYTVRVDPGKAGEITADQQTELAEFLSRNVPHMEVTDRMLLLAREVCGDEQNVVKQAQRIFQWVLDHSNHYSLPGAPKSSGKGSAEYCLLEKGGGCTDQHSLFISLARARGIPTRLEFGARLQPKNEGKDHDPGYRCWLEYFVQNYGWIPMDISAADTQTDRSEFYFNGLDERRVWFSGGRNLMLTPPQQSEPINLLIGAYVEVDGKPHTAFTRSMNFVEVPAEKTATLRLSDPAPR